MIRSYRFEGVDEPPVGPRNQKRPTVGLMHTGTVFQVSHLPKS